MFENFDIPITFHYLEINVNLYNKPQMVFIHGKNIFLKFPRISYFYKTDFPIKIFVNEFHL